MLLVMTMHNIVLMYLYSFQLRNQLVSLRVPYSILYCIHETCIGIGASVTEKITYYFILCLGEKLL